ncbi:MAG: NAD(P)H-dependent glycerol-3-phosphate dehydrogenase [Bacteroidetes bacterium]|nr:NAD(P)H-dependent glycerol-3-phosphate dehydrogenase [Bacteroidota bacterium]
MEVNSEKVAVIGAGSWGTALAVSLAKAGHQVRLWVRRAEAADVMRSERRNVAYLPELHIPESILITEDLAEAVEDATCWLIAVPSQGVRAVAERVREWQSEGLLVVSVAKGIENGTLMTTSQVLLDVFDRLSPTQVAVLYGPSHAEEVGRKAPTTVVASSLCAPTAARVQDIFMTPTLRVYVNTDLKGVEIAGSVKNVLAIAAGISDGVGYGDNAKAAILTRGLAEIKRLGVALGANEGTFGGLAGIGDLVVTCMSTLSRNRNLGFAIGQGKSLQEVQADMTMVAEGVRTTQSVMELARIMNVEMPITAAVHSILFENVPPEAAVRKLMMRSAKQEEWIVSDPTC